MREKQKHYFDCPTEALYMLTHFEGLEVEDEDENGERYVSADFDWKKLDSILFMDDKIFIAAESNGIFEKREGDMCDPKTGDIIFRDGRHFFTPKKIEQGEK